MSSHNKELVQAFHFDVFDPGRLSGRERDGQPACDTTCTIL